MNTVLPTAVVKEEFSNCFVVSSIKWSLFSSSFMRPALSYFNFLLAQPTIRFTFLILLTIATVVVVVDQPDNSLTANDIAANINCFCPADVFRSYNSSMIDL
jgi:hypothetical protein